MSGVWEVSFVLFPIIPALAGGDGKFGMIVQLSPSQTEERAGLAAGAFPQNQRCDPIGS